MKKICRLSQSLGLILCLGTFAWAVSQGCAHAPTPAEQYAVASETFSGLQDEFHTFYAMQSRSVMKPEDLVRLDELEETWVALEAACLAALDDLEHGRAGASARWDEARLRVIEWLVRMGAKR